MMPSNSVIQIFNEMAGSYDDISDLWYSWLFSRLHYFIAEDMAEVWIDRDQHVLDIGCGTGLQSFLYASIGASVIGIDVADELIRMARQKLNEPAWQKMPTSLFPSHYDFVDTYNKRINDLLVHRFGDLQPYPPEFTIASATSLPFPANEFTHVNCCGSVLSLLEDHHAALDEIARVLKPNGSFILEFEGKFNMEVLWQLADLVLHGKLQYDVSKTEALAPLCTAKDAPVEVDFPFGMPDNPIYMNLKLFSRRYIEDQLKKRGLIPMKWRSIHSVTNFLPSTVLDSSRPSKILEYTFQILSRIEEIIPVYIPGASIVVTGKLSR